MKFLNEHTIRDTDIKFINDIGNSRGDVETKIAWLKKMRERYHGYIEIQ